MNPREIAAQLSSFSPQQLGAMDHASLYSARAHVPPEQQGMISQYEHRAFAREASRENPLMALPIAAGTLAYQPYKMLTGQARSAPGLGQVGQGLMGVGEGLWGAFQDGMSKLSRTAGTNTPTSSTGFLESLRGYLREPSKPNMNHR